MVVEDNGLKYEIKRKARRMRFPGHDDDLELSSGFLL